MALDMAVRQQKNVSTVPVSGGMKIEKAKESSKKPVARALSDLSDLFRAIPAVGESRVDFPIIEWVEESTDHSVGERRSQTGDEPEPSDFQSRTQYNDSSQKRSRHESNGLSLFRKSKRRLSLPLCSYGHDPCGSVPSYVQNDLKC